MSDQLQRWRLVRTSSLNRQRAAALISSLSTYSFNELGPFLEFKAANNYTIQLLIARARAHTKKQHLFILGWLFVTGTVRRRLNHTSAQANTRHTIRIISRYDDCEDVMRSTFTPEHRLTVAHTIRGIGERLWLSSAFPQSANCAIKSGGKMRQFFPTDKNAMCKQLDDRSFFCHFDAIQRDRTFCRFADIKARKNTHTHTNPSPTKPIDNGAIFFSAILALCETEQ